MNVVYLVSTGNNKNNIEYINKNLDYKFLSISNHKIMDNISNLLKNIDNIYTSEDVKCIEAGIHLGTSNKVIVTVDSSFNKLKYYSKISLDDKEELWRKLVKDFNYKLNSESINEVKKRVSSALKLVLFHKPDTNCVIVTHKSVIIALLSIWCEVGLNYDNNVIMDYKGKTIIDGVWNKPLVFKLCFEGKDLLSLERVTF